MDIPVRLPRPQSRGFTLQRGTMPGWLISSIEVLLSVFVVVRLAGLRAPVVHTATCSLISAEIPQPLDSFSQPSLATALLKQEAERLTAISLAMVDEAPADSSGTVGKSVPVHDVYIEPMERLRLDCQSLVTDMNRKLMLVYSRGNHWNEFLDRYLAFIGSEPQNPALLTWSRCALDCSVVCGRTDEVIDAMDHVAKFHPELKSAGFLKDILREWRTGNEKSAKHLSLALPGPSRSVPATPALDARQ